MKLIKVKIPATTANFGSGFDSFGAALSLYNEIEVVVDTSTTKLTIDIEGEGKNTLPRDEKNIVYQAMKKVFDSLHFTPPSLHIKLFNRIPLSSGLGSSAAASLGGLLIANKICYNKYLSNDEILKLAIDLEGHPDNIVPAFLGGFCICYRSNSDAYNNYLKLRMPPDLKAVVCAPDFELPTKFARKILPKKVPLADAVFNLSRSALLISAIFDNNYKLIKTAMEDRLHQRYRAKYIPGIDEAFKFALIAGAYGVAVSGAGPSILAISSFKNSKKVAEALKKGFGVKNIKSRSFILDFSNEGAKILCH